MRCEVFRSQLQNISILNHPNINTFNKSINTLGLNILVFENDCTQNFIIIDFSVDKLQQILSDNER